VSKFSAWIYAFRLRTLPLAFSCIITGSAMAFADNRSGFNWLAFVLCLLTTLLLQVLSNLANDYGDSEKGTDNHERIGPRRAVQAGLLSLSEIRTGIVICMLLALVCGVWLIYEGTKGLHFGNSVFFFVLGIGAIAAAIKYTVGKNAYGYSGFGDLFVMLFFGFVGVGGSYYLLSHTINPSVLLPAFTIGAFATAVLNLNNMRDWHGDERAGKRTLVVKLGLERAKIYHTLLIVLACLSAVIYVFLNLHSSFQFLFIITFILFRKHLAQVRRIEDPREFDPLLRQLAIFTFIFSILFGVGMIVGSVG